MIEYVNSFLLLTLLGIIYYIYYTCRRFFCVINIVMDSAILNQLSNIEKEVNSEVTKSKRGRKKKTDTEINEDKDNDIIEGRDRLITCIYLVTQNILSGNSIQLNSTQNILSGNSKQYLGKEYTEQQINEMDGNNINILSNGYKSVLSAQMTKSLGKSFINLYSNVACTVLGVSNQQDLSDDLKCDPFLNTSMQRFKCDLYHCFGAFLAPVSVGIITGKHYAFFNSGTKLNDRSDNGNCESATRNCNKKEEPSEN